MNKIKDEYVRKFAEVLNEVKKDSNYNEKELNYFLKGIRDFIKKQGATEEQLKLFDKLINKAPV